METLSIKANAKINLSLDIVGKRENGYHNLRTIMHELPLFDDISLTLDEGEGVTAHTNLKFISSESNLAAKAAALFLSAAGKRRSVSLNLFKRIPVGAGLGGGSADAAAVLKALNSHFGFPLSEKQLLELGKSLGADVPFCILGGCALCEEIGDVMTPLPTLPHCHIAVVKPKVSISTPEMFKFYDRMKIKLRPDTGGIISALHAGDLPAVSRRLYNVMEEAAKNFTKDISELRGTLLRGGALGACMSGSGSAVYGIFDSPGAAEAAVKPFGRGVSVFLLEI
ncbi:MAG: 4-(cytidine 5'-diphospho)-2-C-methyl-D-erythritol kinase [Oscillospiraceae bacterium]|jgi:4-diphosphocytidyl-2-C-methyl-D-erythritol kinase|nr:4-(cytidine 5'-diphospho)-2-C-methyl-D-erythritol kinase [Oscillospiraceae bacterium]